jgi:dolichyl-phosphate beta-glucosyltransferase
VTGTPGDPGLSVILPVYASTAMACASCRTLVDYLEGGRTSWEILVVDDGGNDFHGSPLPDHPGVRLLRHDRNQGKGAAVRTGMLAARGTARIYTDADLPYDLDLLPTLEGHIRAGFHLAIGDRTLPGSSFTAPRGQARRALSGLASAFIGSLVTGGFYDTQCGIKAFRGDVAAELFRLSTIPGFAFDVEVLYVALKHRLDIKRVPVQLRRDDRSSVRVVRDSIRSVRDILGIKARQLQGRYASPFLEELVAEEARQARAAARQPDHGAGAPRG